MGQKKEITEETWEKIRQEYVSSSVSYRELCSKYGIVKNTLCRRAAKGGWVQQRENFRAKSQAKVDSKMAADHSKLYERACSVSEMILDKIEYNLKNISPLPGSELKAYTGAIKDMREMGMFRSTLDKKEQEARIRKLEKDASEETKDASITVTFESKLDEYSD